MKLEIDLSPTIEQQLSEVAKNVWADAMKEEFRRTVFPTWMSLAEACDYIGISRSSLNKFIEKGLAVSKIRQVKRINKQDIDEFLKNNQI